MSTVNDFKECLQVVNQLTFHESNWGNENWKQVWSKINQDVLTDAFEKYALVRSIFSDLGELTFRKCKSFSRVEKKVIEQLSKENYFEVVCDFIAVRIHCNLNEIQEKIDRIRDIVLVNKVQMHIKGSSNDCPYGFFTSPRKEYRDITQYVFVFLEKVGYPIEFQIGHEFASHTFK